MKGKQKGSDKTGGRSKGTPNKETVVKQLLYNSLWDEVGNKITSDGIHKCWNEMDKLEGKDYVYAFMGMLEYFKPKLQRSEFTGDKGGPIQTAAIQNLTFDQAYELKYGRKPGDTATD